MTETEDLKLKTEMVQKMGAMIFFAEKALRSIALNHAEAARSGVTEALRCLDGKLPNSAPAEPSGNTGELPVCATCCGKGLVNWEPCPDCSADQPATEQQLTFCTRGAGHDGPCNGLEAEECIIARVRQERAEQPRIWRCSTADGSSRSPVDTESRVRLYAQKWVGGGMKPFIVQYSTDNGETWIDEQAEREGK